MAERDSGERESGRSLMAWWHDDDDDNDDDEDDDEDFLNHENISVVIFLNLDFLGYLMLNITTSLITILYYILNTLSVFA